MLAFRGRSHGAGDPEIWSVGGREKERRGRVTCFCVDEQENGDEGNGDSQPHEVVMVFWSMCGGGDSRDGEISVCEETSGGSENESGSVLLSSMMVR